MPSTSDAPLVQIFGLSHVVMRVSDLERSIKFYESVFGLQIHSDTRGAGGAGAAPTIMGVLGGVVVELIETKAAPVRRGRDDPGYSCIAFSVPDAEAALATLKTQGLTRFPEVVATAGGHKVMMFRDPDGNVLELIEVAGGKSIAEVASRAARSG